MTGGTGKGTTSEMREFLQNEHGHPIALRLRGCVLVACPYCAKWHEHAPGPGHVDALCDESVRQTITIQVGDRQYIPNYGYTILEYEPDDEGVHQIVS